MKHKIIALFVILFGVLSCNTDDDTNDNTTTCDFVTIISSEQFVTAPSDQIDINTIEINDDCLNISFSASGCDGDSWVLKLIDSEAIAESNPVQRTLRLSLKNLEECEAYITTSLSFDISNLQVDDNQVLLNVIGIDGSIIYEY